MQRAAGGGNAVRAIACLPALAGHWRDPAGGLLLSTSGNYPVDATRLYRPDLLAGRTPRTINMSTIGRDLLHAVPPIDALIVYNSNPVAVAPQSREVAAGFEREDLFTVVLEHFQTDTADYADFVLPATTQLEHVDVHKSYGHLYILANNPAIDPLGEALPNSEIFRQLAARMGFDEAAFRGVGRRTCRASVCARRADGELRLVTAQGGRVGTARPAGRATRLLLTGSFPTPSGKCEFYAEALQRIGVDPLPNYVPPNEGPTSNPDLARRFPLAMISPPARNFLNSSFVNVASLRPVEGEPTLEIHPNDARARGIVTGQMVRVFNDRGNLSLRAVVSDRARPGCVVALSIWWKKLAADRRNANEVTGMALTDIGRAPTFYDCLVEVAPAD